MLYNMAQPAFPREDIDDILAAFQRILEGKGMLTMHRYVDAFESAFSEHIGSDFSVATNSCTAALEIALQALELGPEDEVILPCQTFFATGSAIVRNGAVPIFTEVDDNFLLDIDDVRERVTERTRAVILVHFCGLIHPRIEELRKFLSSRNIRLIEDAAHAHGAIYRDRYAGNLGDLACFSFYSTKIMTTGEGGMITGDMALRGRICAGLRNRGMDPQSPTEIFNRFGSNHRFTEFQAILGLHQLARLEEFIQHRNLIADIYREELATLEQEGRVAFQQYPDHIRHAYWRFLIRLQDPDDNRQKVRSDLKTNGITVDWPYAPLLHLQPAFMERFGFSPGMLPASESLAETHLCLPMHTGISPDDAKLIAGKLIESLDRCERRYG